MNKKINDLSQETSKNRFEGPMKAVVFGSQPKQVKQMADQLTKKKLEVRTVIQEKLLVPQLFEHDPDLIFLEINGNTKSPIEDIVQLVFMWIHNHARKVNEALNSPSARLWSKAKVIIYKSDTDAEVINPTGPTIADYDEVLFKCQQAGNIHYIGLYSPWSFISKVTPLLVVQEHS